MSRFMSDDAYCEVVKMTDHNNLHTAEEERSLPSPRFDDSANATAQPVQPIPRLNRIAGKLPVLALVVMSGLVIGTIGGIALVREQSPAVEPPPASESVSELTVSPTRTEEWSAAEVGAMGLFSDELNTTPSRRSRSRARTNGERRAYRVAVIR
jgi:hypothetical protein